MPLGGGEAPCLPGAIGAGLRGRRAANGCRTRRLLPRALPGSPLARVPLPRPRTEDQHQPRVRLGPDLVPLLRIEVREQPGAARDALPAAVDLDLALRHQQVGALVNLVLLELLARGEA